MPTCPQCGVSCDYVKSKKCILCGADLMQSQTPKSEKVQEIEGQLEVLQVDDDKVPPFSDKGGFSKKNKPKEVAIGQLKVDNEALKRELNTLEEIYKKEHPEAKPWYTSFGNWFASLLVLGLLYLIYWWVKSQGGLPHELYEFIRRIRL